MKPKSGRKNVELKNYGWLNDGENPERDAARAKCRASNPPHKVTDVDVGPPHRGMEHVVTCEECGYVYRYDSSD
jgi:hypothetical protein